MCIFANTASSRDKPLKTEKLCIAQAVVYTFMGDIC